MLGFFVFKVPRGRGVPYRGAFGRLPEGCFRSRGWAVFVFSFPLFFCRARRCCGISSPRLYFRGLGHLSTRTRQKISAIVVHRRLVPGGLVPAKLPPRPVLFTSIFARWPSIRPEVRNKLLGTPDSKRASTFLDSYIRKKNHSAQHPLIGRGRNPNGARQKKAKRKTEKRRQLGFEQTPGSGRQAPRQYGRLGLHNTSPSASSPKYISTPSRSATPPQKRTARNLKTAMNTPRECLLGSKAARWPAPSQRQAARSAASRRSQLAIEKDNPSLKGVLSKDYGPRIPR